MSIKKNSLWNLFGSVAPMLIGLFAIPYIYREIGAEKIGVLTIIWALIGYFSIFDFGLGRSITQRISSINAHKDITHIIRTSSTGVVITLIIGMVGALIGYLLLKIFGVEWINTKPELESEIYLSFILSCLAIPITTVTTGMRGILEGIQRFDQVNLLRFALGISNFLGPIFSIYYWGSDLSVIVLSLVITRLVILFAHLFCVKNFLRINKDNINKRESERLFQFAGWLTLSNLISPLMVVADRFFISSMLGAAVVSFYTIPADFLIRLLVIPFAITSSLFPVFSAGIAERNKSINSIYKKSLLFVLRLMLPIVLVIIFSSKWALGVWLGEDFAFHAHIVASVMAVGILFNSMAQIPHAYIQASGDAKTTALIHLLESFIYVPILVVGVDLYGVVGGAVAWTTRCLMDFVLLQYCAVRLKSTL